MSSFCSGISTITPTEPKGRRFSCTPLVRGRVGRPFAAHPVCSPVCFNRGRTASTGSSKAHAAMVPREPLPAGRGSSNTGAWGYVENQRAVTISLTAPPCKPDTRKNPGLCVHEGDQCLYRFLKDSVNTLSKV